jgi:apolipoprotein N-acyltransferase
MSSGPSIHQPRWKRIILVWWPWLAAAASGGLLPLCFAPWNQAWLGWFALTPLIAAVWFGGWQNAPAPRPVEACAQAAPSVGGKLRTILRRLPTAFGRLPRWTRAFALGYVAGLIYFWCVFYWLTQVTGPGWFLLGPYMGLYVALWAWFIGTVGNAEPVPRAAAEVPAPLPSFALRRGGESPAMASRYLRSRWNLWFAFLGASAWTAMEWVRGWMFSGFGWNGLGASLHANLPFVQLAEWTGVGGLTFLLVFANLIAVSTVRRFLLEVRNHKIRPHFDFTLTLAMILLVFTNGVRLLRSSAAAVETNPDAFLSLRVAAVQANIPQSVKWNAAFEKQIFETYERLTDAALIGKPQLLLWPEAATPKGVFADEANYRFMNEIAKRVDGSFLLGTLDYDFGEDGRALRDYNAALLLPKDGDAQIYRKVHLVPFGEYVPFRQSFPPLAWIVGDQVPADFAHGPGPMIFQTVEPAVRIAPLICFEDSLGRLVRQPVLMGAQLLVNITNDAWFGFTAASEQHLDEAVFRAVENRRPLVRCANTGVTAFVDRDGRVTHSLRSERGDPFVKGVLAGTVRVPVDPPLTFYTRHGEIFSIACAAAAAMTALLSAWRNLRAARRKRGNPTPASAPEASELESVR